MDGTSGSGGAGRVGGSSPRAMAPVISAMPPTLSVRSGAEQTHANRNGNLHHNGTVAISVVVCVIRITFIIIDAITIVTTVIMIIATIIVVICTISKHLIKSPPPTTIVHRRPQRHLMIIRTSSSASTSASQSPIFPHQLQSQWKMLLTPQRKIPRRLITVENPATAVDDRAAAVENPATAVTHWNLPLPLALLPPLPENLPLRLPLLLSMAFR